MITLDPLLSPVSQTGKLEFSRVGDLAWQVRIQPETQLIGILRFHEFSSSQSAAFLRIEQSKFGSFSWLAEAINCMLDFGFDKLKLSKVSVRADQDQLSILAALEDIGFVEKARSSGGMKIRLQATRYSYLAAMAQSLMLEHIEDRQWSFGFDNGRRRAGLCSYTDKKITVSKYLSLVHSIDDVRQTVLHEIAHAICGPKEGHSKKWLATAKSIGYRNETYTGEEIAKEFAPYTGLCPNGHRHYRYQRPKRLYSCHICHQGFDKRYMIDWVIRS
jgi:predicted SprT family Zn-dependent metalloprotease